MHHKQDIRALNYKQLEEFFLAHGEKKIRAKELTNWLYKKSVVNFAEMTDLKSGLVEFLENHFYINPITIEKKQVSDDRTIKNAFKLHDGNIVEGVLIPSDNRMTACVSSQVGCSLTCKFCATGKLDRIRNLEVGEIYDQVAIIKQQSESHYNMPLSNVVFMGMGEPLLNYNNVLQAIEQLTSGQGLNMAPRRITVSTAGIAKMIKKLGDDEVNFNLALSLHAANDKKRENIMPINEHNNLDALIKALQYFYAKTKSVVMLEYIVFNNFNDELHDAEELFQFAKQVPCKVNLIEYNSIGDSIYKNTSEEKLEAFQQYLYERDVFVTRRRSRGKDIDAACGQLANKNLA
ncbi:MAG: 23S rRNA (adenine(2503)-C(2))-methyltransferase RlmN [Bacteroidetes bacterium]|nr:23S rRNA (adenine(2503)-C(2))-methyltransferase RlmN [Bacteroidota bacterium]